MGGGLHNPLDDAPILADIATVDTVVDGIQTDLDNVTDGLGALKALIDAVQATANTIEGYTDILDDATNGLANIKTLIDALQGTANTIEGYTDILDDATNGLANIKSLIDTLQGDVTAILTDTGTTIPGTITTLQTAVTGIQNDLDNGTDGLTALKAIMDTSGVLANARTAAYTRLVGVPQVKATTIDLHQAAATYDLVTGTTQDVIITGLALRLPNIDVSDDVGGITGITVQTNDAEPVAFITAAMGVVANLTAESQHGREACHILLKATKKIQLTLVGGTADADPTTCDVVITCHAVVDGGYLA